MKIRISRRDGILIGIVLLAAVLLAGGIFLARAGQSPSRLVRVYVNGALYAQSTLGSGERIEVVQENGARNTVCITNTGFYMEYSSCKNQLCIHQGEVTTGNYRGRALGAHVICLPNGVDVELVLTREEAEGVPDA